MKGNIPVIPHGYKSSPSTKTKARTYSNPTRSIEFTMKGTEYKSYMDSDRNLRMKENFNKDNFITKLAILKTDETCDNTDC